jgi:hypothetical protein
MKPHVNLLAIASVFVLSSCFKNDKTFSKTDYELFKMAEKKEGFVWYKNSEEFLDKSTGTGHSNPLLRTRYNAIAATMLDGNGRIMEGVNFPEGSLIVKELYDADKKLERYAILYKNATSPDADANGWVWGYINSNNTTATAAPASLKGKSCVSCHSQENNIDYMLMNKYF